jgi:exodeoxyribonuclease VII large subunit
MRLRLLRAARRALAGSRESVIGFEQRLLFSSPARRVAGDRARIEEAVPRLSASMRHRAAIARERLARLAASLSSLSPLGVLERGYAVVWKTAGATALRAASEVQPGEELRIRLARGGLRARVESREDEDG